MTEPRSPEDEPIIELTDVIEPSPTGDDDIIELTDAVKTPSTVDEEVIDLTEVVDSAPTADENIIELTEVVDSAPAADENIIELTEVVDSAPAADDDLIELTEVVEAKSTAEAAGSELATADSAPPAEEGIIDLLDVVDKPPKAAAAVPGESEATAEAEDNFEQPEPEDAPEPTEDLAREDLAASEAPVFDLFDESALNDAVTATASETELDFAPMDLDIEEAKSEDLFDSLGMKLEPDLQTGEGHDELDFNLSTQELSDAIDLLDAKLAEDPAGDAPASMGPVEALTSSVSQAQVEKALENVIRKMYAEKIDLLLNEAIEKNVSAEIKRLKEQLLTDSPED